MTVQIRPRQADDGPAVRPVITAAFADDGQVANLADALRARPDLQLDLVATSDEQVIGHVHLSIGWLDTATEVLDVLVLSPLAVAPSHQRHGIGTRLLAAATTAARDRAPLIFLEGSPDFYGSRGWRRASELALDSPSERIPDAAFQVVTLPGYDRAVMRGRLVYNDTFWTHRAVGP